MTHYHLIGIGGTGLSAIARLLLERGEQVSGSDRQFSPLAQSLQEAGVRVDTGHRAENIQGADLVVRSSAVPDDNVEVVAARSAGIPVLKRADFLGALMENSLGIAIAGTHGKTTTTAMIAWILSALGRDPSYLIGGVSANLGSNAHAGQGAEFVVEADEYDRMFLGLKPAIAVVTNVEHDHPDCYPTAESFFAAFESFARLVPADGALLVCGDDPGAAGLLDKALERGTPAFSYGLDSPAYDYYAGSLRHNAKGGFTFNAAIRSQASSGQVAPVEGEFTVALKVPGTHNVTNALAALGVAHRLGLPLEAAALALGEFEGTGRRFEVRGEVAGVTVVDDYAHHPTEIRATLSAARDRYGDQRLWAVWQPHTYSRTRTLKNEFLQAFQTADRAVVTEIYAAREAPQNGLSGEWISRQLADAQPHLEPYFAPDLEAASTFLLKELRPGDVLLVLSAGDADRISSQVLAGLQQRERAAAAHREAPGRAASGTASDLQAYFGDRLRTRIPLARYTAARVGGPADLLVEVSSVEELVDALTFLWQAGQPFFLLGGGSNVLVSDGGVRGLVLLNRARQVRFDEQGEAPQVWAESGANFGLVARQAARKGFSGLEWAAGIPGTVGGAVYGNAGAHGGDMAGSLVLAEILHQRTGEAPLREIWTGERFEFTYRSSRLKREAGDGGPRSVVLSAQLRLSPSTQEAVQARLDEYVAFRRRTQPPGASMGSMFKNPAGDYAGRLIEAAGLKGTRVGDAEISPLHANFFINHGGASAGDIYHLIQLARRTVAEKFGIELELEIGLVGNWYQENTPLDDTDVVKF